MCLRSSCSRTTCSWRDLVHTANHRTSALELSWAASSVTRVRSVLVGGVRLGEPLVVRLLHVGVLPLDDRLRAHLLEVLLEFVAPLVGEDFVRDVLARLFERFRLGRRGAFELQD